MIKLNLFFVLLLITVFLRYIVFGAFEPLMFSMIFLFPVAALAIFIISKKLAVKERSYQSKDIADWSFYNKNEVLLGSLKRNHIMSGVQVIDVQDNRPEYIVALMLHSYYFK